MATASFEGSRSKEVCSGSGKGIFFSPPQPGGRGKYSFPEEETEKRRRRRRRRKKKKGSQRTSDNFYHTVDVRFKIANLFDSSIPATLWTEQFLITVRKAS